MCFRVEAFLKYRSFEYCAYTDNGFRKCSCVCVCGGGEVKGLKVTWASSFGSC